MDLTRRHMLGGAAAIAAAPLIAPVAGNAAAPPAGKQVPGVYRSKVGDIEVTAITDGTTTFNLPDTFVVNKTKADVNEALAKAFLPQDKMSISYAPVGVNSGGKLIVIDTGNGPAAFNSSKGLMGQYQSNLAAAGNRSQGSRYGCDLALPSGPHQRSARFGRQTDLRQRRSAGAGRRVEILHG